MSEDPETSPISRRRALFNAAGLGLGAAAVLAGVGSKEASAQATPPVEILTVRHFSYQAPRERVRFPAADMLKWVKETLMKDQAFLKALQSIRPLPGGGTTIVKTIVVDLSQARPFFKDLSIEQRLLWPDFFTGAERPRNDVDHIKAIIVEAYQMPEQISGRVTIRITFENVPGVAEVGQSRTNVVLRSFTMSRGL